MRRRGWQCLTLIALAAVAWGSGTAEEAILLSREAEGLLELQGETRLVISGLHGRLSVRQGKAGELRFASRRFDDRDARRPVALWLDGPTLRFAPLDDAADDPVWLEISTGPELEARLELSDSSVYLAGLHGAVEVEGSRLELAGRTIEGSLDLEVSESKVQVLGVTGGLRLDGVEVEARLENVSGDVVLTLEGGSVALGNIRGEVDGDLSGAELTANHVTSHLTLEVHDGAVSLNGCTAGADLELARSPLQLSGTEGSVRVDAEADDVRFQGHTGPLIIRGREVGVHGSLASGGPLEIDTADAPIVLEDFESPTTIRGDNLEIQLTDSKGEVAVQTAYSEIVVLKPQERVTIASDFGDVEVHEAQKLVRVRSRDGAVRVDQPSRAVEVEADGPGVSVSWSRLEGTETSTITNARGDVRLRVPANVRCQIDARADYGRIETDIDELRVSEDGHSAAGILRGGRGRAPQVKRPTIRVESAGDIYLYASQGSPAGTRAD